MTPYQPAIHHCTGRSRWHKKNCTKFVSFVIVDNVERKESKFWSAHYICRIWLTWHSLNQGISQITTDCQTCWSNNNNKVGQTQGASYRKMLELQNHQSFVTKRIKITTYLSGICNTISFKSLHFYDIHDFILAFGARSAERQEVMVRITSGHHIWIPDTMYKYKVLK